MDSLGRLSSHIARTLLWHHNLIDIPGLVRQEVIEMHALRTHGIAELGRVPAPTGCSTTTVRHV